MDRAKPILDKLVEKEVISNLQEEIDNEFQVFTFHLNKEYFKEYKYLKEKFLNLGYILIKYDLSLECTLSRKEDADRLQIIDICFKGVDFQDLLKQTLNLHSYQLIDDKIYAYDYGVWDLTTKEGQQDTLKELINLERTSLNLFNLSQICLHNIITITDYTSMVNEIYNTMDVSNRNLNNNDEEEGEKEN